MITEEMISKALEGKFFWEPSRDPDELTGPNERAIREAQRRYNTRPKKTEYLTLSAELDAAVEKITKMVRTNRDVTKNADPLVLLKNAVAFTHGVEPTKVVAYTNHPKVIKAKNHYYWTSLRHFPEFTISEIARQLGRHHSVIIHSRDKFEGIKAGFMKEIEIVDRVMENVKCG